jgi:predicted enzyme related to lactoylglutathione lyase
MSRVVHFEIGIDNPPRAIKFYTDVFGWKVDQWQTPQGPMDYWLVTTGKKREMGIDGALAPRSNYPQPVVNTISVPSVDEYMTKIKAAGGQVLTEKMPIPTIGWFATCKDSEGNIFGILENDPKAH